MALEDTYDVGGAASEPIPLPVDLTNPITTSGPNNTSTGNYSSDLIRALIGLYSAGQYGENMQDAQDSLVQAIARAAASREGLKIDTQDFYNKSSQTLANDVQAFLPMVQGAGAGAARGEQYGKDMTSYVRDMVGQGRAGVDSDLAAALSRLGGARDTALSDLAGIFGPAQQSAQGELAHQRTLGNEVTSFARKGAEDARRITTPLLEATAARYMAPNQYTDAGIRGVLSRSAIAGVNDAFDTNQRSAINQAVRSGTGGGQIISDLTRERSDAASSALLKAAADSIGRATTINGGRRGQEAANFKGLSDSLQAREALVPQAYDIASKGSLGAQNLIAALAQAYGGQVGSTNNTFMTGTAGLSNSGMNAKAGLSQTGATAGAQGFNVAAQSAAQGDATKGALTKSLIDNYFAGMRGNTGAVFDNTRSAWLGDMQATSQIAPKQASISAGQAQADPYGVLAGQVLGGVAGKALDKGINWAIDKGADWVGSWF